ncbi:2-C-methyl-D-erythritol 4-phosphate cytidylyltransferase [Bifidobacterium pseudolongum subsp. globosum]|uniref:2-C-methyl-D-erythritol 4-phosphate cytidylyltransferase n=1 Tax=Bifidobacterium pseudolongum subsp. globosum TaxID=1690 RepID=A0A8B3RMR4_9BIFI|nr:MULTISPECIES: IspD/TarI family cytidylyltransferase [Bifidobacterium]MCI6773307.1 2-C-methyl-D-erythritol 4-phosphate cytidylyltransferase [Bifidobacterium pseudolongum]ATO40464.1 2-C-methyl-D-erythritol 4-phosphate cytidylyltransferase [Bifidobacterium pseudolongum subsp. globosum DSM 20092]KFI76919.1 2-C-methyl-D-erythritol 4-phosphate cytidylyltransferase [Bifidobacterium pseudolongum subsp. globosum]MBQ1599606.1 2-C-methyl-D-erythritol 4-phosphate cytidylyltransferase [Bifidobacterium sp
MTTAQTTPVVAVVLAAGSGLRFDPANPKQLVSLAGTPIVGWSIAAFERNPRVTDILVVVNAQVRQAVEQLIAAAGYTKVQAVIDGGAERSDSTEAALRMLADHGVPADAKVLIHDSVRPFVSQAQIDGCIDALDEFKAATVACPSTDTILLTQDLGDRETVVQVPERRHSFRAQTPQAFRFETIRTAYGLAADDPDFRPTDDTRVVVDYLPNEPVAIVGGSPLNMKVTTQDDMPFAQLIAGRLAE